MGCDASMRPVVGKRKPAPISEPAPPFGSEGEAGLGETVRHSTDKSEGPSVYAFGGGSD